MAVQLKFNSMDDFEPAKVVEQVEPLKKLMETRDKLRDLLTKVDRSDDLESLLERVLKNTRGDEEAEGRPRRGQRRQGSRRGGLIHEHRRTSRHPRRRPQAAESRRRRSRSTRSSRATKQHAAGADRGAHPHPRRGGAGARSASTRTSPRRSSDDRGDRRGDVASSSPRSCTTPSFQKLEGTWRGLQLPGHEPRDQRHAEDQGAQRLQEGAVQGPGQGRRVRPEPDLQEALRERVRHRPAASRTAP